MDFDEIKDNSKSKISNSRSNERKRFIQIKAQKKPEEEKDISALYMDDSQLINRSDTQVQIYRNKTQDTG